MDLMIGIVVAALVLLVIAVFVWRYLVHKKDVHDEGVWSDRYDAHEKLHGDIHQGKKSRKGPRHLRDAGDVEGDVENAERTDLDPPQDPTHRAG